MVRAIWLASSASCLVGWRNRTRSHGLIGNECRIQCPGLGPDMKTTERVDVLKGLPGGGRPRRRSGEPSRSWRSTCRTEAVRLVVIDLDVEPSACGAKFRKQHITIEPVSAGSVDAHRPLA